MSAQHFKEIVNTVLMTCKISKRHLCREIEISQAKLDQWIREGISLKHYYIVGRIRKFMLADITKKAI